MVLSGLIMKPYNLAIKRMKADPELYFCQIGFRGLLVRRLPGGVWHVVGKPQHKTRHKLLKKLVFVERLGTAYLYRPQPALQRTTKTIIHWIEGTKAHWSNLPVDEA